MQKLLLHICCGPCATPVIPNLNLEFNVSGYYCNPNIYPETEFAHRLDSAKKAAEFNGITIIVPKPVTLGRYESYINFIDDIRTKPERCFLCYKLRLEKTAEYARANGFDSFSTTLLISPFQYHKELKRIGEDIGKQLKVEFYYQDFRPLYEESRKLAKAMNLYLQKYCGCKPSRKRR